VQLTIDRTGSQLAALRPRGDAADLLALCIVLAFVCSSVITTSLQISEYRWEEAAKIAFYARMPAPVVIPPLVDFVGRERLLAEAAGSVLIIGVWAILIRWSLSGLHPAKRQRQQRLGSATFDASEQLQAIRESVKRGADSWQNPLERVDFVKRRKRSVPEHRPNRDFHDLGVEYVDFTYRGPEELRAAAATSFRLAAGPVSSRLADELEALGETLQREAAAVEGGDYRNDE
jgi:hypothetical protein